MSIQRKNNENISENKTILDLMKNSKTPASTTLPSSQYWRYKLKTDFPEEWARIQKKREENLQKYVERAKKVREEVIRSIQSEK